MTIANFALNHYRGLFATLIVLVVLGLASISSLPMSIYPKVAFARVVVVAQNGEMAPAQVQQTITRPIEQAVATITGVTLVQANSAQGASEVSVTFEPHSDLNLDLQRINAALSQLRAALPAGTDTDAQLVNPNIFPVLGYTVDVPGMSPADVRNLVEFQIKPGLTGIPGVAQIRIVGGRQTEYWVSVDPRRAAALGIQLDKIADAISANNQITAVGHYNAFSQRQIVLVSGAPRGPSDIAAIVVDNRHGTPVTVGDIATVHTALNPKTSLVSAQGREAVLLNVYAQPGGNVVQIYRDVDAALARETASLGQSAQVKPYWNQATLVSDAVNNLRDAIAIGALLAILVVWFFLGSLRSTLVAAVVIPLTTAIAFFFMRLFGQGLNLMTLGGLAVGVGLVIVDAIFVVESIWRHLEAGDGKIPAVRRAMQEIAAPMIGSTVTTVVVFAPMALLSGVTGAFFTALSITLTITLALSLFFALYITPLLSAYFLKSELVSGARRPIGHRTMDALLRAYEPALRWFLKHRRAAFIVSGAVIVATLVIGHGLGTDFMPEMDEGAFEFNFRMPTGTSLEETDRVVNQLEAILQQNPNIVGYAALTGLDPSGFFPAPQNAGNIRATLLERDRRRDGIVAVLDDIRAKVAARVPILNFSITQILQDLLNDLSNAPSTIEIKVFGSDPAELSKLAVTIDERIKHVRGVVDDFDGVIYANPNTLVHLLPVAGSHAGFTTDSLTRAVQAGLNGDIVTSLAHSPAPIPVRLRYDVPWNQQFGDLQNMPIVAPNGATYSLGALASIEPVSPSTELNEENLRQIVRVTANVSNRDLGSTIGDITQALADLKLPGGYSVTYGGRYALQQESFREFGVAIGVAILLVFLVMVFEFRNFKIPLVVISSVPLSLFGVVIALRLTGVPLNVSSFMGLILLVGGVVKNGILLFDEVDRLSRTDLDFDGVMLKAGRIRMRPILMTTLTSLLGVLPLALGLGAGSEMQKPLAVATIGGLVFSTFFTLLLMPAFYATFAGSKIRIIPDLLADHDKQVEQVKVLA
jgi:CzcA family heavy metal efflux pump